MKLVVYSHRSFVHLAHRAPLLLPMALPPNATFDRDEGPHIDGIITEEIAAKFQTRRRSATPKVARDGINFSDMRITEKGCRII